jgi:hypothetical protein
MSSRLPIDTSPPGSTLNRFWCRTVAKPVIGHWSRGFSGWCAYHEEVQRIRHNITSWEPIADHAKRDPAKIRG